MTELLTAAQMRAIEQAAIESGAVTGLELMERAGQRVVDAIFAEWPELAAPKPSAPAAGGAGGSTPSPLRGSPPEYLGQDDNARRAVVLCGPGNNGGDGFVVARLLKEAGWDVEVFLYGDADKLPPDAKVNYERWVAQNPLNRHGSLFKGEELIIDAIFGTGVKRPSEGAFRDAIRSLGIKRLGDAAPKVVGIDMPSGLCADSGKPIGVVVRADLTVSTGPLKVGHIVDDGPSNCGKLRSVDIGVYPWRADQSDKSFMSELGNVIQRPGPEYWGFSEALSKSEAGHKYSHGHVLILSGGVGKGGAARLAGRAALRVGAGAVTVGQPPAALIENAAQLNAIMLTAIKDAAQLAEILQDTRINALCIGPGLGLGARERALLITALEITRPGLDPGPQTGGQSRGPGTSPGRGLVLDADALTLIAQDETLFAKLHENCILTPHAGEFARLFPDIAEKLNAPATTGPAYSKVDATRDAAKRAGCVALFKGPDTVIADPSGRCSINASVYERAAPWLATAGSGDVLAGFITGLLARGFAPMQAAETGAWLHTECALSFGPGLIAEDLPEELPNVFRKLGL